MQETTTAQLKSDLILSEYSMHTSIRFYMVLHAKLFPLFDKGLDSIENSIWPQYHDILLAKYDIEGINYGTVFHSSLCSNS